MLRFFSFTVEKSASLQPVGPSAQPGTKGGSARSGRSTTLRSSLLGSRLLGSGLLCSNFFLRGSFCHGISLSQIVRIISNKSTMHNFDSAVDIENSFCMGF